MRILAVFVLLAALTLDTAHAQAPGFDRAMRASVELQLAAGADRVPPSLGQPTALVMIPRSQARRRKLGTTLMLVGVGGIVAGAIVGGGGGTALVIGGIGCMGYGFYLFQAGVNTR